VSVWWRTAAVLGPLLLGGCAHGAGQGKANDGPECSGDPLAACTRQPERYPDLLVGLADPVAPLVGRTIAQVRFRKGYLAADEAAQGLLAAKLQPLDVVLVSSKGRLTGNVIPGLFTHTVVHLGSEAQLKRLGLWNSRGIKPYQAEISAGKSFIESDRKGVHLSSIEQVIDTDRVLVLRPRIRDSAWMRKSLCGLLGHVGSRFDFRFDAGETNRLYCSELAFHVLPELDLPVRHLYGRDVVLPDDIAATGLTPRTRLAFALYISGGPEGWTNAPRRTAVSDLVAQWRK